MLEHGHGNVSLASVWCLYMKVCVGGSETRCTFYVVKMLKYYFSTHVGVFVIPVCMCVNMGKF